LRQAFVLANQHRRWELNDLAGRLDSQPAAVELCKGLVPAPARSVSGLSPDGYRMLQAIGVSAETVKRWLSRGLRLVTDQQADLAPVDKPPDAI
jgi:RNA polymerase sigma-70 factor (ECF subfamily)